MPDYKELFSSPDFEAYQSLVVDEVVAWLRDQLLNAQSTASIKDGMRLANNILSIPSRRPEANGELGKRFKARTQARLIEIPALLFRKEIS